MSVWISTTDRMPPINEQVLILFKDKKDEERYIKEVFVNAKKYGNPDMKFAYYEGIEDALSVLSHKRLANIKTIRKGKEYEQNYD